MPDAGYLSLCESGIGTIEQRKGTELVAARDSRFWIGLSWTILKWSTLIGLLLGFVPSALSLVSGNTISVSGTAISGWTGVWIVTLACGLGGFLFGAIWALVFRALAVASER